MRRALEVVLVVYDSKSEVSVLGERGARDRPRALARGDPERDVQHVGIVDVEGHVYGGAG